MMSSSGKRKAGEAFEDTAPALTSSKSHKKRRKHGQSSRSIDDTDAEPTIDNSRPDEDNTSVHSAKQQISAQVTKAKEKRRRRKEKAKRSRTEVASTADSAQATQNTTETSKEDGKKKRRKRKRTKSKAYQHDLDDANDNENGNPSSGADHTQADVEKSEIQGKHISKESQDCQDVTATGFLPEHESGTSTSPKRKKGRKKSKGATDEVQQAVIAPDVAEGSPKGNSKGTKKRKKGWVLSDHETGGLFIDQDPILTPDDQHLIIATKSEIRTYARSTSLMTESFRPGAEGSIVSCALSASDPSKVFVGKAKGQIDLISRTDSSISPVWSTESTLRGFVPFSTSENSEGLVVLSDTPNAQSMMRSISLVQLSNSSPAQSHRILERPGLDDYFQFFERYGLLVAFAYSRLIIGHCPEFGKTGSEHSNFTWREVTTPGSITSFDARTTPSSAKTGRSIPQLDVAVGLKRGEIIVYQDILRNLINKEKNNHSQDMISNGLHWHRDAVNTVKWSRDGNYIISGGNETVLVIWQLDTSQRQYLPHLSTGIMNLTVSENGSSYALRLADNSVMVLSTADLVPSTNISGVAIDQRGNHVSAVISPRSPEHLLLVVPRNCSQQKGSHSKSSNQLQTWDYGADLQIRRQALTRNMITAVSVGPGGESIPEPHVTQMQISSDGQWLATVEEWHRSQRGKNFDMWIDGEDGFADNQLEVTLKFWTYNIEHEDWELNTRVDAPHGQPSREVQTLVAHPTRVEFATSGDDQSVRIWTAKARKRDGVAVRNADGQQLYTWTKKTTIHTNPSPFKTATQPILPESAMAYSEDGSVLAVAWPDHVSDSTTHLLDCESSEAAQQISGLLENGRGNGQSASLAFAGRFLFVITEMLCVYDIIDARIVFKHDYYEPKLCYQPAGIAINKVDSTIAIALNSSSEPSHSCVKLLKLDELSAKPALDKRVAGPVKTLLACPYSSGYVLIDGYSNIRQVRRAGKTNVPQQITEKDQDEVKRGLDSIFGQRTPSQRLVDQANQSGLLQIEQQSTLNSLEAALNFQNSSQAPSASNLFSKIASIFASAALPAQLRT